MLQQAIASRAIPTERNTFIRVDLVSLYLFFEKGFARGLLIIPTTEESPNAESKIESPESGDYNPHRSVRDTIVTENLKYS